MSSASNRYRLVHELFRRVVELDQAARTELLARECAGDDELRREVESLLEADSEGAPIDEAAGGAAAAALAREVEHVPERIGAYRIVREIGRGGMGTVYEALQDAPQRRVAIKVMRSDLADAELLRRLEREAQVLGSLQHPGIAHIYEAGLDATRPFLVMEYIDGRPLDEFAREEDLGFRERMDLLARVCDAVQHAHDTGIVHRDLKPANVLVDRRGQPKVLDFGIAAVQSAELQLSTLATLPGRIIGTLPYMSPEQVGGNSAELDARADVYALGAVLFELLCGRRPHELHGHSLPEAARILRDEEPTRLSAISTEFRGDVETIVQKALAKDRDRRYASASALAGDLRRFLRGQPIVARPSSTFYQLRKFAARNRLFVGAVGVVIGVLAAGFVTSSVLFVRAEEARKGEQHQRRQFEDAASKAVALNDVLTELLTQANPLVRPDARETAVGDLLDAAAENLEANPPQHAEVTATVHHTIGTAYGVLGRYAEARTQLSRALELRTELFGAAHAEVIESAIGLAEVLVELGELGAARDECERALRSARALVSEEPGLAADAHSAFASVATRSSEYELAAHHFEKALELRRPLDDQSIGTAKDMEGFAGVLFFRGEYAESERVIRDAIAFNREHHGDSHPLTGESLGNLGVLLATRGELAQAGDAYRAAHRVFVDAFGEVHPLVANSFTNQARLAERRGELGLAEDLMRDALGRWRDLHGERHPQVATVLHNLGALVEKRGRSEEAKELFERAYGMREELLGTHTSTAETAMALARLERGRGELDGAEALLRQVIGMREEIYGPSFFLGAALGELALVLMERGQLERSIELCNEGLAMIDAAPVGQVTDELRATTLRIARALVRAHVARGELDAATAIARGRRGLAEDRWGADHATTRAWVEELRALTAAGSEERE